MLASMSFGFEIPGDDIGESDIRELRRNGSDFFQCFSQEFGGLEWLRGIDEGDQGQSRPS